VVEKGTEPGPRDNGLWWLENKKREKSPNLEPEKSLLLGFTETHVAQQDWIKTLAQRLG
jgi:hypothetical protein